MNKQFAHIVCLLVPIKVLSEFVVIQIVKPNFVKEVDNLSSELPAVFEAIDDNKDATGWRCVIDVLHGGFCFVECFLFEKR